jgi:hypothetical protein
MSEQSSSNRPPQKSGPGSANNNRRPQGRNNNRRRHHNRPNPNQEPRANHNPGQQQRPENRPALIDRIYEKYQNLLDQHLIARKKFHDLFYRADLTLKDIRDFEGKLNPAERELFEKRNNGLNLDTTYSALNAENLSGATQVIPEGPSDPHFMQSQKLASYKDDKEESLGSKADYEKYKLTY